jgi:glycosyltransferase involved in cell wall biosynthesis
MISTWNIVPEKGTIRLKKYSVLNLINMNPRKFGAVEEYAMLLSKRIIERGHFAAVGFLEYPPPWLMERFNSLGIRVLKFKSSSGTIRFILELRKAIQKYNLSIVHGTFYPTYSLDLIIGTMVNGCKLIYSDQESRTSHPSGGIKNIFRLIRNRLYGKYIHTIIADAEFIKECQIRDHFTRPDKLSVIYNGVNLQRFGKTDSGQRPHILSKFHISPESSIIVTIAKCIPEKGLNYFLEAAKTIIATRPNSFFFIVGDGPEQSALDQQASRLGLKDKVIFAGLRVDTEVFLSVADVFVLLSTWEEAFAFSLLEAMASGCPVVASRIGAIPESVLDGVTGILVPPKDSKAAADAILKLLNDDELRLKMSVAARKRVEENFSLEQWVNKTIEVYEKALAT